MNCELCGTPVIVFGGETKHYEPIKPNADDLVKGLIKRFKSAPLSDTWWWDDTITVYDMLLLFQKEQSKIT